MSEQPPKPPEGVTQEKHSEALLQREEAAGVPALARTPAIEVSATAGIVPPLGTPEHSAEASANKNGEDAFDKALEAVAHRMERVKMPRAYVHGLLKPNAELRLHDVAMQWAGMPNKNERAATQEVLQALTAAGFLHATGEETWIVIHPLE